MTDLSNLTNETLYSFLECQLEGWPMAKKNYAAFKDIERKKFSFGRYEMFVQFNPARIISTVAKVSDGKVDERPCFLCECNRPPEQNKIEILPGWDLLVNPFPIFPIHFTISSATHRPQDKVPLEIVNIAEKLIGMTVFFNGARAGASAPDHLHLQAVLTDELPLMKEAERIHKYDTPGLFSSEELGSDVPYLYFSGLVEPNKEGRSILMAGLNLGGLSSDGYFTDSTKANYFFWIDNDGFLRFVVVPRVAHRPSCFFSNNDAQLLVSPGCIDMAGVIITPREEDFIKIQREDILKIYSEVAISNEQTK